MTIRSHSYPKFELQVLTFISCLGKTKNKSNFHLTPVMFACVICSYQYSTASPQSQHHSSTGNTSTELLIM